jgi:hypothetical protein
MWLAISSIVLSSAIAFNVLVLCLTYRLGNTQWENEPRANGKTAPIERLSGQRTAWLTR